MIQSHPEYAEHDNIVTFKENNPFCTIAYENLL